MKNIFSIFTTLLLVVALQQNLSAQNSPKFMNADKEEFNNSIKMNLMNALFSYPSFAYERRFDQHFALQVEGNFRMGGKSNTASTSFSSESKSISSFIIYPAVRYYFYKSEKMKLENYFSLYYKYRSFQSTSNHSSDYSNDGIDYSNTYNETTNGAGLLLGIQTAQTQHFVFDLFFGTQMQTISGKWDFFDKNASLSGFKQNFSLSSASDVFSFMNSSSLRAGFTIGVRF